MLLTINFLNFWAFLEDEILINLHKVVEPVEIPYGFKVHCLLEVSMVQFFNIILFEKVEILKSAV